MDFSFGLGGSSFGSIPSFSYGGGTSGIGPVSNGDVYARSVETGTAPSASDSGGSWWSQLAGLGLGVTNTVLGYKLMDSQINHGQIPSISFNGAGQPTGIPSGVNSGLASLLGSGWVLWALLIVVAVLMFKK